MTCTFRAAGLAMVVALAPALAAHAADLQPGESRAVLVNPAPHPVDAVIDGRIWHCEGNGCAAQPTDGAAEQTPVHECHRAATWLGQFSAYRTGPVTFGDAELAACNLHVTTKEPRSPG